MIAAAIFLSAKIFETERKIRDILNMTFSVTSLHRILLAEQERSEEGRILTMKQIIEDRELAEVIQPNYSISSISYDR